MTLLSTLSNSFLLVCCPNIQVPMARASILWLMGEYCERVPKIAPDVLRKMATTFTAEEDIVKLQTVNLAAKLYLTNSKQVQNKAQHPRDVCFVDLSMGATLMLVNSTDF